MEFAFVGLASLVSAVVAAFYTWVQKKRRKRLRDTVRQHVSIEQPTVATVGSEVAALDDLVLNALAVSATAGPTANTAVALADAQKEIDSLKARIAQVEDHFQDDTTPATAGYVTDVKLSAAVLYLERAVRDLDQKMLGPWDVAKIVFAIFAAIGVISGILFQLLPTSGAG